MSIIGASHTLPHQACTPQTRTSLPALPRRHSFDSRMISISARKVFCTVYTETFGLGTLCYRAVRQDCELRQLASSYSEEHAVGEWALYLVIALLAIGNTLFLSNTYLYASAFCLLLFQVPTTIMFETTNYERFYSFSAVGGVCAIASVSRPRST